jgi:DNA-binding transcriptional MerR regulator
VRYRFYREHKYVSFELSELERLIAKTDFKDNSQIDKVTKQLMSLEAMLKGHAAWEDVSIHELLRAKGSNLYMSIEEDHKNHEGTLKQFQNKLDNIINCPDLIEKLNLGYEFYLLYRLFVAENLNHLHKEETIIMPELHRLYSDKDLQKLDFGTYSRMTPDQMVHMMEVLFPHMDINDYEHFLRDIKNSEPEKFQEAWADLSKKIPLKTANTLAKTLHQL